MRFVARLQFLLLLELGAPTAFAASQSAVAVPRPSAPSAPQSARGGVRLVVNVNGHRQLAETGRALRVVRGDKVVVESVDGRAASKWSVKAEGMGPGRPDVLGKPLDTANFPKDATPAFRVWDGAQDLGPVALDVLEPEFRYAVIRLNGQSLVVKDQETLRVLATDRYKVERVVTNLPELDADVTYDVEAVGADAGADGPQRFRLRFKRNGRAFGAIPLEVTERF